MKCPKCDREILEVVGECMYCKIGIPALYGRISGYSTRNAGRYSTGIPHKKINLQKLKGGIK